MALRSAPLRASILLLLVRATTAIYNNPYNDWFPTGQNEVNLNDALATTCHPDLLAYQKNSNMRTCRPVVSCLIGGMEEIEKANMAGAAVLLGLMPTILSAIGPSSAEMALLFTHRPLLAFLIAFGAPSIFPARPGEYADPTESLRMREGTRKVLMGRGFTGRGMTLIVTLVQYILVCAAVGNGLQTMIQAGTRGIVAFRCNSTLLPLVWVLWAIFIHGIALLSYMLSKTYTLSRRDHSEQQAQQTNGGLFKTWWRNELKPCANHPRLRPAATDENWVVLILNYCASFIGLIHIVFGTLVFASLLFVNIEWALYIVLRMIVSALLCRSVMSFEIASLRNPQAVGQEHETMPGGAPLEDMYKGHRGGAQMTRESSE